jgi:hypothetical protein
MTIVNGCSSFWFVRHRFGGRDHGLKLLNLVAPCWLILIKNGKLCDWTDSKTIRKENPKWQMCGDQMVMCCKQIMWYLFGGLWFLIGYRDVFNHVNSSKKNQQLIIVNYFKINWHLRNSFCVWTYVMCVGQIGVVRHRFGVFGCVQSFNA